MWDEGSEPEFDKVLYQLGSCLVQSGSWHLQLSGFKICVSLATERDNNSLSKPKLPSKVGRVVRFNNAFVSSKAQGTNVELPWNQNRGPYIRMNGDGAGVVSQESQLCWPCVSHNGAEEGGRTGNWKLMEEGKVISKAGRVE